MSDTTRVRVADGDVWVDGEHLTHGDECDIPTSVYERIPGSFVLVDDSDEGATDGEDDTETVDSEEDVDDGNDEDVDEWADWNEDDWLALGYEQRADDVEAGRVDDHLDAVEACERSATVEGAVEQRRAELED